MEPPNYPTAFRERWYLVLLGAILGVLVAAGVGAALPRTYESTATLFLRVDSPESSLIERSQFALARVKSYPDLVASPQVLRRTLAQLDLDMSTQQLAARVSAANPRDTVLLTVTASAPTAESASDTANAVATNLSELVDELENTDDESQYRVTLTLTLPAAEPASPASPQLLILLGLGFLGGLAVGAIAVAAITRLDPRARTIASVRALTGLPVVGQLPRRLTRATRRGVYPRRVEESLRSTVVNLRLMSGSARPAVLVLVPAQGPRSRADAALTGLARAVRASGRSVLAIADEPTTPTAFVDFFLGLREWVESWGAPEPPEADPRSRRRTLDAGADGDRRVALLRAVSDGIARFDVVLVLAGRDSDVFTLPELVGAQVLVLADARRTSREDLVDTTTSLEFAGIRPLGVLMTAVSRSSRADLPATWTETDRVEAVAASVALPAPARPRPRARGENPARGRRHKGPARAAAQPTPAPDDAHPEPPDADGGERADDELDETSAAVRQEPLPGLEPEPV